MNLLLGESMLWRSYHLHLGKAQFAEQIRRHKIRQRSVVRAEVVVLPAPATCLVIPPGTQSTQGGREDRSYERTRRLPEHRVDLLWAEAERAAQVCCELCQDRGVLQRLFDQGCNCLA